MIGLYFDIIEHVLKSWRLDKEDLRIAAAVFIGFVAFVGVVIWYEQFRKARMWDMTESGDSAETETSEGNSAPGVATSAPIDDKNELNSMNCMRGPWNICQKKNRDQKRSSRSAQ